MTYIKTPCPPAGNGDAQRLPKANIYSEVIRAYTNSSTTKMLVSKSDHQEQVNNCHLVGTQVWYCDRAWSPDRFRLLLQDVCESQFSSSFSSSLRNSAPFEGQREQVHPRGAVHSCRCCHGPLLEMEQSLRSLQK